MKVLLKIYKELTLGSHPWCINSLRLQRDKKKSYIRDDFGFTKYGTMDFTLDV